MSRSLVSFRLADDLKLALKERANTEGISTTELVTRLLRQGLSSEKMSFSSENRLSELENTVQHILRMFELDRRKREAFSPSDYAMERRLVEVEEKLQQIFSDVEDRRQKLMTLMREKGNAIGDGQDTRSKGCSSDSEGVSLKELCSLLQPTSQPTEVE